MVPFDVGSLIFVKLKGGRGNLTLIREFFLIFIFLNYNIKFSLFSMGKLNCPGMASKSDWNRCYRQQIQGVTFRKS